MSTSLIVLLSSVSLVEKFVSNVVMSWGTNSAWKNLMLLMVNNKRIGYDIHSAVQLSGEKGKD